MGVILHTYLDNDLRHYNVINKARNVVKNNGANKEANYDTVVVTFVKNVNHG